MGYTEPVCQICGISFNIGRIRRHDEPESAAWQYYHSDFITLEDCGGERGEAEGCSNAPRHTRRTSVVDNNDADNAADEGKSNHDLDHDELEHLAGPDCTCTQGYSGWRITVEEMQDRLQCQLLAPKLEDWQPESDDEGFEIQAKHCWLTGISTEGAADFELEGLRPVRHGLESTTPDNNPCMYMNEPSALPMHPHCFLMFKRLSQMRLGKIDIDALWSLREAEGNYQNRFDDFPMPSDLKIVCEQWYRCEVGTEYLASDPLDVAGLEELLKSCSSDEGNASEVIFETMKFIGEESGDPFAQLSTELCQMLLTHLSRPNVANLRLVSRSFGQLPQSYFHRLVRTDMPWVWEVEDLAGRGTDWHAMWLKLWAADGGSGMDEKERRWLQDVPGHKHAALKNQLAAEGLIMPGPEFFSECEKRSVEIQEEVDAEIKAGYDAGMWPARKTGELRGLRNRRRIWGDLEEIMRRIAKLSLNEEK